MRIGMYLMTYTEVADLLSSKWAEILGWISIPAFGSALLLGVVKIIVALINRKIGKGTYSSVLKKQDEVINEVRMTVADVKQVFELKVKEYKDEMHNQINLALEEGRAKKQEIYNKIIGINQDFLEKVEEVKEKAEEKALELITKAEELKEEAIERTTEFKEELTEGFTELKEQAIEEIKLIKEEVIEDTGVFER